MKKEIIIYQGNKGEILLKGDFKQETVWASQAQIVDLFGVDQSVVSRHVKNIFKDGEIDEKSNMQKMHIANSDKPVSYYSLDVILAIGHRTNSKVAVEFRKWATKTLREHITKGYTFNKKVLAKNYGEFLKAIEIIKKLLPNDSQFHTADALELVKLFAGTWFSLDAYNKSSLPKSGLSKKQVDFTAEEFSRALEELKKDLLKKKEASELFAQEMRANAIQGIIGSVFQTVFGKDAYATTEEKAAHLLYFNYNYA